MKQVEIDLSSIKSVMKVEIDSSEAFRLLCEALMMDFVLIDDNFYTKSNERGELEVWLGDKVIDDRGELYEALCSVARCMFPGY